MYRRCSIILSKWRQRGFNKTVLFKVDAALGGLLGKHAKYNPPQPAVAGVLMETAMPEKIDGNVWKGQRVLANGEAKSFARRFGQFIRNRHDEIAAAHDVGNGSEMRQRQSHRALNARVG